MHFQLFIFIGLLHQISFSTNLTADPSNKRKLRTADVTGDDVKVYSNDNSLFENRSASSASAPSCRLVRPCACQGETSIIQLQPLAQLLAKSKGYLTTEGMVDGHTLTFYFNPCSPLRNVDQNCEDYSDSSCYEQKSIPPSYHGIGTLNSLEFTDSTPPMVQLELTHDEETPASATQVQCVCAKDNIDNPSFRFLTSKTSSIPAKTTFVFQLIHTCCCPDSCKDGLPSGGGGGDGGGGGKMSYGTLIAILFAAFVVVYFVAGMTFQKYKRGESGRDLIPNRTFWAELPGLVRDGAKFIYFSCKGSRGYSYIPG